GRSPTKEAQLGVGPQALLKKGRRLLVPAGRWSRAKAKKRSQEEPLRAGRLFGRSAPRLLESTAEQSPHLARQGELLRSPGGGTRDADPGEAVASRGLDVVADRRTAVPRIAAPRPAAPNAKVSLFGTLRIFIICSVVLAISVRAPLPDVAM